MRMAEWVQMAGSLVSVLMLCGIIFNFSVIKPLNQSVRSLQECIDHLRFLRRKPNARRWRNAFPGWRRQQTMCSTAWM